MSKAFPSSGDDEVKATAARTSAFATLYASRGRYQDPTTPQTLREALAEYYVVNPGLLPPASMTDKAAATYFRSHDLTHVVFGTHTGPLDEGVNDLLTMFGVDVSYVDYIRGFFAAKDAAKTIGDQYKKLPLGVLLQSLGWTLRLLPTVWRACRSMSKKWPWNPEEHLLDRPLVDVRAEYGIEIWRPEVRLNINAEKSSQPGV